MTDIMDASVLLEVTLASPVSYSLIREILALNKLVHSALFRLHAQQPGGE